MLGGVKINICGGARSAPRFFILFWVEKLGLGGYYPPLESLGGYYPFNPLLPTRLRFIRRDSFSILPLIFLLSAWLPPCVSAQRVSVLQLNCLLSKCTFLCIAIYTYNTYLINLQYSNIESVLIPFLYINSYLQ